MNFSQGAVAQMPKSTQFSIAPTEYEDAAETVLVVTEVGADVEYRGVVSVGGVSLY